MEGQRCAAPPGSEMEFLGELRIGGEETGGKDYLK